MGRAMGFVGLAMLTVFPLLVVVAAAGAVAHHGVARWVIYGMGLTGSSASAVVQVFAAPGRVLSTTSAFSVLLPAVFGVTFAGSVQAGFERVWGLPAGPWHKFWRQAVWLTVLIAYIYAAATGKITMFPIVLVGSDYWAPLLDFLKNTMLGRGCIGASELALLRIADDPEEVVKIIKEAHTDLEF